MRVKVDDDDDDYDDDWGWWMENMDGVPSSAETSALTLVDLFR